MCDIVELSDSTFTLNGSKFRSKYKTIDFEQLRKELLDPTINICDKYNMCYRTVMKFRMALDVCRIINGKKYYQVCLINDYNNIRHDLTMCILRQIHISVIVKRYGLNARIVNELMDDMVSVSWFTSINPNIIFNKG